MNNVFPINKFLNLINDDNILKACYDTSFKASVIMDVIEEETNINVVNAVTKVLLNDIKTYNNIFFMNARRTFFKEEYQTFQNPFRKLAWLFIAEDFLNNRQKDNKNLAYEIANKNKIIFYKVDNELTLEETKYLINQLEKALD